MKPTQCQWAENATDQPRCTKPATCKWGDHWFCDEHGNRHLSANRYERSRQLAEADRLLSEAFKNWG